MVPEPFSLDDLVRQLERRNGRPVVLTPVSVPADGVTVCGKCLRFSHYDHVFYAETLSPLHGTHNAVHEIAHLILEHRAVAPLAWSALDPGQHGDSDGVEAVMASLGVTGAGYAETAEHEADAMAAVLLGKWQDSAPQRWVSTSALRVVGDRLVDALG